MGKTIGDEFREHYKNKITDTEIQQFVKDNAVGLHYDGEKWYLRFKEKIN